MEASAADHGLQREHKFEKLDARGRAHLAYLKAEAMKQGTPERARWIYFRSPDWTWASECGREGWLLYDHETRTQHAFSMTAMN